MISEHHRIDDQVATGDDAPGAAPATASLARLRLQAFHKDYIRHQFLTLQALKTFVKTDFQGLVSMRAPFAQLRQDLGPDRDASKINPAE